MPSSINTNKQISQPIKHRNSSSYPNTPVKSISHNFNNVKSSKAVTGKPSSFSTLKRLSPISVLKQKKISFTYLRYHFEFFYNSKYHSFSWLGELSSEKYVSLSLIGQGQFGGVATVSSKQYPDISSRERVIKTIKIQPLLSPRHPITDCFTEELNILAALDLPSIPRFFGFFSKNPQFNKPRRIPKVNELSLEALDPVLLPLNALNALPSETKSLSVLTENKKRISLTGTKSDAQVVKISKIGINVASDMTKKKTVAGSTHSYSSSSTATTPKRDIKFPKRNLSDSKCRESPALNSPSCTASPRAADLRMKAVVSSSFPVDRQISKTKQNDKNNFLENMSSTIPCNIFETENVEILMETIPGRTVMSLLDESMTLSHKPLPELLVVYIIRTLCQTLHHAHCRGIVHKDVKAENLILRDATHKWGSLPVASLPPSIGNSLALVDWGLSESLRQRPSTFRPPARMQSSNPCSSGDTGTCPESAILPEQSLWSCFLPAGSTSYMAPEVFDVTPFEKESLPSLSSTSGCTNFSDVSDCWSVGVLSTFLLYGRFPFEGNSKDAAIDSIKNSALTLPPASLPNISTPDVSPLALDFIRRLLVRDTERRLLMSEALLHPWLAKPHFKVDGLHFMAHLDPVAIMHQVHKFAIESSPIQRALQELVVRRVPSPFFPLAILILNHYDSNMDGYLSRSDIRRFLSHLTHPTANSAIFDQGSSSSGIERIISNLFAIQPCPSSSLRTLANLSPSLLDRIRGCEMESILPTLPAFGDTSPTKPLAPPSICCAPSAVRLISQANFNVGRPPYLPSSMNMDELINSNTPTTATSMAGANSSRRTFANFSSAPSVPPPLPPISISSNSAAATPISWGTGLGFSSLCALTTDKTPHELLDYSREVFNILSKGKERISKCEWKVLFPIFVHVNKNGEKQVDDDDGEGFYIPKWLKENDINFDEFHNLVWGN